MWLVSVVVRRYIDILIIIINISYIYTPLVGERSEPPLSDELSEFSLYLYIYIYIYTLAVIKNWSLHQNHDTVVKSMLSSPNMTILVFT